MATWRELLSAAGRFSGATVISRVLGLVRDICLFAWIPTAQLDAFFASLTVSSTFRQFFAEGTLSSALIPILTQTKSEDGEEAARHAAWAILRGLALAAGAVCVLAILTADWYTPVLLRGWQADASFPLELAQVLVKIIFPFLLFVSLAAWCMGVLNIHNIYFIPAVSPALYNLSVLATLGASVAFAPEENRVYWAAWGVVLGGSVQLAIQLRPIGKIGYTPRLRGPILHPRTRQFLRAAAPAFFGLAIYQLNILTNRLFFGSYLEEGSVVSLFGAFRLVQFPQGVLGVAIAAAAFPRIAASVEARDPATTGRTIQRSLELLAVLLIPASVGLAMVGEDLARAFLNVGSYAESGGVRILIPALMAYCVGLVAFSSTKIAVQLSYAHHDFLTPVWVALGAFGVNVGISSLSVFVFQWDAWGLAIAASLASWVQLSVLLLVQRRRLGSFRSGRLAWVVVRVLLATLAMGALLALLMGALPEAASRTMHTVRLLVGVLTGAVVYACAGMVLFREELFAALHPRSAVAEETGLDSDKGPR